MSEEVPIPNPPLGEEEAAFAAELSVEDLAVIDGAILSASDVNWRKVARVVGETWNGLKDRYPQLSDLFYTERIAYLAQSGKLDSQGNLSVMRFSEVRLRNET